MEKAKKNWSDVRIRKDMSYEELKEECGPELWAELNNDFAKAEQINADQIANAPDLTLEELLIEIQESIDKTNAELSRISPGYSDPRQAFIHTKKLEQAFKIVIAYVFTRYYNRIKSSIANRRRSNPSLNWIATLRQ